MLCIPPPRSSHSAKHDCTTRILSTELHEGGMHCSQFANINPKGHCLKQTRLGSCDHSFCMYFESQQYQHNSISPLGKPSFKKKVRFYEKLSQTGGGPPKEITFKIQQIQSNFVLGSMLVHSGPEQRIMRTSGALGNFSQWVCELDPYRPHQIGVCSAKFWTSPELCHSSLSF